MATIPVEHFFFAHTVLVCAVYILNFLKITNSKRYHSCTSRGLEQNNHIKFLCLSMAITFNLIITQGVGVLAHRSMRMLVYTSCLFTCQLRDLSRNFPRRTPPQITVFFLEL